jgi:hypothetical protein
MTKAVNGRETRMGKVGDVKLCPIVICKEKLTLIGKKLSPKTNISMRASFNLQAREDADIQDGGMYISGFIMPNSQ